MQTIIPINPVSVWNSTATQIQITAITLELGTSSQCQYLLQDANHNALVAGFSSLTPTQYNNWGSDDNYFINCILSNLGLTAVTPLT